MGSNSHNKVIQIDHVNINADKVKHYVSPQLINKFVNIILALAATEKVT